LLSGRTGTDILIGFCIPLPGGRYRIYATNTFNAPRDTDKETIQNLTEKITIATEEEIRKKPQYWLWMYKRWKTKKPGRETAGYPWYSSTPKAGSRTK
jgi:lauroyl/myristoyl acyltransferase